MDYDHIKRLSDRLIDRICSAVPDVIRNGDAEHGYPGCVNLSFAYVEGESMLMALKQIALSSGRSAEFLRSVITLNIVSFRDEDTPFAFRAVLQFHNLRLFV